MRSSFIAYRRTHFVAFAVASLAAGCAGVDASALDENEGLATDVSIELETTDTTCASATTLAGLVTCIRGQMPRKDSEGYIPPSETQRAELRDVVSSMLNGHCGFALPAHLDGVMSLSRFTDGENGKTYCVLMEVEDADTDGYVDRGFGTFIVDPTASRELIQEAPHPLADAETEVEAVDVFKGTNSRGYLMCGAHRLANPEASTCDPDYHEADCAHDTSTMFHAAALEIDAFYGGRPHHQIQWHGMADETCASVSAYVSHGLSTQPPAGSVATALAVAAVAHNPTWVVANPGSDTCTLNATDNVQGRLLNGTAEPNVCTTAATASTDRFVHIEQHRDMRVASSWLSPVAETFPIPAPTPPTSLAATPGNAQVTLSWVASNGASGYRVLRSTKSNGPYSAVATGVLTTGWVDRNVKNGTTYHYVVRAQNALGTSVSSSSVSATPALGY
ncbi:fibronectin type III domain-containing protein [Polyangium aurulentum]|uniref:fibronectin type III domain-containing protein n=1 Tax=Polyangium aurulentum TaxID=2567896 RepID=UPI0010ADE478|nr:fibronectin type III domain-containing protein [Polyangium aurulentum]UQA60291.1 fibronectin type III domain-containing protein [Polyangium aurulentum]